MRKIIVILVLIVLAGGVFYLYSQRLSVPENEDRTVSINGHKFTVEIADNFQERSKGLGERESLCDSCGMLFEFPEKGKHSFWMKDMNFSLDIIWILDDEIAYITENIPPDSKGSISPNVEADRVLEINAGLVSEYSIKKGDKVIIK